MAITTESMNEHIKYLLDHPEVGRVVRNAMNDVHGAESHADMHARRQAAVAVHDAETQQIAADRQSRRPQAGPEQQKYDAETANIMQARNQSRPTFDGSTANRPANSPTIGDGLSDGMRRFANGIQLPQGTARQVSGIKMPAA